MACAQKRAKFSLTADHARQLYQKLRTEFGFCGRQAIAQAADKAGHTRDLLARHGVACPTITGAGTGTFDYGRNLDHDGAPTKAFEPSLFVWATVMSRPTEDRAIVDAGLKALAFDSGPPLVCDEPAATYEHASDGHGPPRPIGRHQPPRARRQDPPDPRPLRPDHQPLRLVCLHPRGPCRAALADH
jgi:hypothetical protein